MMDGRDGELMMDAAGSAAAAAAAAAAAVGGAVGGAVGSGVLGASMAVDEARARARAEADNGVRLPQNNTVSNNVISDYGVWDKQVRWAVGGARAAGTASLGGYQQYRTTCRAFISAAALCLSALRQLVRTAAACILNLRRAGTSRYVGGPLMEKPSILWLLLIAVVRPQRWPAGFVSLAITHSLPTRPSPLSLTPFFVAWPLERSVP